LETTLYNEDLYIKKALKYSNHIFICSDHSGVVDKIKNTYPDVNIYSLSQEKSDGYFHEKFARLSADNRKQHTLTLFANVEIISKASTFIGTIDSNIGMFIGMRDTVKNCLDIDGRAWDLY